MTRRRIIIASLIAGTCLAAGFALLAHFTAERRYEFDTVNLRMRYCEANLFYEHCGQPVDHATGQRLRELGVLPPVSATEAKWELIKGFKPGVRGWMGYGHDYVRRLGASTWLTPVPLPASENLVENIWVRWATNNSDDARAFWQAQRALAPAQPILAVDRLLVAMRYLEDHDARASNDEVETQIRKA
ncbi:MAG: hypothetical protein AB7U73_18010 [Pirellulales bacterium]